MYVCIYIHTYINKYIHTYMYIYISPPPLRPPTGHLCRYLAEPYRLKERNIPRGGGDACDQESYIPPT